MPKPSPKARGKAAAPTPRGRWAVRSALLLLAVAGFLAGLIALGRWGLEQLRGHERYLVPVAEIACEPPAGLDRAAFLEQVRFYHPALPERVDLLDEELPQRLKLAFADHPWVEAVDDVAVAPPRQITVRLTYRRPVLAVRWGGELRAVDGHGVLLPKSAPTAGLPVYDGTPAPPRGREGTRWGDPNLEQAARARRPTSPQAPG